MQQHSAQTRVSNGALMITPGQNDSSATGIFESLDLSGVKFPSDGISIGMLRQMHPKMFDVGFGLAQKDQPVYFFSDHAQKDVGSILYCERQIAISAYASARGIALPADMVGIADLREELAQRYASCGIATGDHHAAELIRNFEQQCTALARQNSP